MGSTDAYLKGTSDLSTAASSRPPPPGEIWIHGSRRCAAGESPARASRDAAAASPEPAPRRLALKQVPGAAPP